MRTNKILIALAAATLVASGAMAQSKFWTGAGYTSNWSNAVWGDGNTATKDFAVNPGQTFYLFFKAQFQPGFGNATDWAIINLFLDLTRQSSAFGRNPDYTTYGFTILGNTNQDRDWADNPSNNPNWQGGGYTQQTIRSGDIRANSVNPGNTNFPLVTNKGFAAKVLVTGGAQGYSEAFVVAWLRVIAGNEPGNFELGLNRLAGFDLDGNGSLIGSEGVTVRTNFGTNGNPSSDYGQRFSITIVVPEPASMIALGTGLIGLVALRRRRKA